MREEHDIFQAALRRTLEDYPANASLIGMAEAHAWRDFINACTKASEKHPVEYGRRIQSEGFDMARLCILRQVRLENEARKQVFHN